MNSTSSWHPNLSMMDQNKIQQLHNAAIHILSQIGLNIHHAGMRAKLGQAGAKMGDKAHVYLTTELVAQALDSAKKDIIIFDRLGEPAMPLGAYQIYFGTGSDLIYTYDVKNGEHRSSLLEDLLMNPCCLLGLVHDCLLFLGTHFANDFMGHVLIPSIMIFFDKSQYFNHYNTWCNGKNFRK